jgi:aspartyl-tRNA(Asn)/glutamyl-tRNA(Gln) amidotransferase subunit A
MNWHDVATQKASLDGWKAFVGSRDGEIGSFLQFDPDLGAAETARAGAGAAPTLAGVPFAVKDNIAVRGFRLTCGSRMLKDFVSPYTATAVERLQRAGGVVAGKTNLDEFGMGSSTENSALRETRNPWDPRRVPGGSSGGSAAAVAAGLAAFGLGSDTGGSVRQPASFCGIYGLKPTWGAVSRYGLVAYASSLEVIGVMAKTVDLTEQAFSLMRGQDPRDHSSLAWQPPPVKGGALTIGVPRECAAVPMHPDVKKTLEATRRRLSDLGHRVTEVSFPTLDHVVSSYYVIATAEASANLARFDGVRYGHRTAKADNPESMMVASRTEGLGDEVKLRILLGTYVLRSGFQDEYYLRAQKIRTAIRNDFQRAFGGVDLVLMPVYPVPPFARGSAEADPFSQKLADIFTCAANLAGLPALSFPAGLESGLPIGMQFLGPAFSEGLLFSACRELEQSFPSPDAPGFPAGWR